MPVAISTSGGAHGVCLAAITSVCETMFDFIRLSRYLYQDRYHRDLSGRHPSHVRPCRRVCLVGRLVVTTERMPGNGREQTVTATAGGAGGAVHTVLATRLGMVTVVREGEALTGLYFPRHWPRPDRTTFGPRIDEGFEDVARQLGEYLDGERTAFDVLVKVKGTEFDRRVWELISAVPYGQTTTYGDLARSLGAGTDPRDVGA